MNLKVLVYCLVFLLFSSSNAFGQCNNLNFQTGFTNWKVQHGFNTGAKIEWVSNSIDPARIQIITTTQIDTNTCNGLVISPSAQAGPICKLGNPAFGAQADAISFKIEPNSADLIRVNYAVVLEDPSHIDINQPFFEIRVEDLEGNLIDSNCTFYRIAPNDSISNFKSCGSVKWKNWSNIAIDIRSYKSQALRIRFVTTDCAEGQHFGYAYFNASCISLGEGVSACSGQTLVSISAPAGFKKYQWPNGDTTRSTQIPYPTSDTIVPVQLETFSKCKLSIPIVVRPKPKPNVEFSISNQTCFKSCNASIQANVTTPGTPPYKFQWSFPYSPDSSTAKGLCSGNYQLILRDAVNCSDTVQIQIKEELKPNFSITSTVTPCSCPNSEDGKIELQASIPFNTLEILWNDGNTIDSVRNNLKAQLYTVLTRLPQTMNCRIDTFEVEKPNTIQPYFNHSTLNCIGDFDAYLKVDSINGGTPPYSIFWNTQQLDYNPFPAKDTAFYTLRIQDNSNCSNSFEVQHKQITPGIQFELIDSLNKIQLTPFQIQILNIQSDNPFSTNWLPKLAFSNTTLESAILTSDTNSILLVQLVDALDKCIYTDTIIVHHSIPIQNFSIPNAFTPNGDSKNDVFYVNVNSSTNTQIQFMQIVNRWGEIMYELSGNITEFSWNGTYKNLPQPSGAYYLRLQYIENGKEKHSNTLIYLLR